MVMRKRWLYYLPAVFALVGGVVIALIVGPGPVPECTPPGLGVVYGPCPSGGPNSAQIFIGLAGLVLALILAAVGNYMANRSSA